MATIPGILSDQTLSTATQELIGQFVFIDGEVSESTVEGGVLVSGQGGNRNGTGLFEDQTLFINQGTNAPVSVELVDGALAVTITLPPGVDVGVSGPSGAVNANQMRAYVNNLIDKALDGLPPNPYFDAYKASLEQAIAALRDQVNGQDVVIRVVSFAEGSGSAAETVMTSSTTTGNNIVFDGGNSAADEVFVLRLDQVSDDTTVTLRNVENAMLVDSGTVIIDGNTAAMVVGDITDQKIVGGGGNDTLVGGGGNDTLVGGGGDDVFGFNAVGHYTIEGFGSGNDVLAFDIGTITNVAQLESLITGVSEANGNVTYEFYYGEASITLIGVSADEISAGLVQFTL